MVKSPIPWLLSMDNGWLWGWKEGSYQCPVNDCYRWKRQIPRAPDIPARSPVRVFAARCSVLFCSTCHSSEFIYLWQVIYHVDLSLLLLCKLERNTFGRFPTSVFSWKTVFHYCCTTIPQNLLLPAPNMVCCFFPNLYSYFCFSVYLMWIFS